MEYITKEQPILDVDPERISIKNRIKEINLLLSMNGFAEIGDLLDSTVGSINKTLLAIQTVLNDRQKLLETKSDLVQRLSKAEAENYSTFEKQETAKEKMQELNNKIKFLNNKIATNDKKASEEVDKIKSDRDETTKIYNRLLMKENQYKHELKKSEKEIEDLKIKLKKYLSEQKTPSNPHSAYSSNKDLVSTFKISPEMTANSLNNMDQSNLNSYNLAESIKNSSSTLHNVRNYKEFYNLVFQAFNEKMQYILVENDEMKSCYKLIMREINQYIEYKKLYLYKFSKDSMGDLNMLKEKLASFGLKENIFDLDFNESRETVLNRFNEIINIFRFILMYEHLKIDPHLEFTHDDFKNALNNNKYDIDSIPYYQRFKGAIDGLGIENIQSLVNLLGDSKPVTNLTSSNRRKSGTTRDKVFEPESLKEEAEEVPLSAKSTEPVDTLNRDIIDTINMMEDRFNHIEEGLTVINTK